MRHLKVRRLLLIIFLLCSIWASAQVAQLAMGGAGGPIAGGTNCSACTLETANSTDSGGTNVHTDGTSYPSATLAGHTLWVVFSADHWTAGDTATITGSCSTSGGAEVETWHRADTGATGATATELQAGTGEGVIAWYALNITGCPGVYTITVQTQGCVTNLCALGGTYLSISGPHSFDGGNNSGFATSTGTTNGANCGAVTPTANNDFWVSALDSTGGAFTAGTSPISFTVFASANQDVERAVYSGWSSGALTPTWAAPASGTTYGCFVTAFK